jgi:hypothetical protein
LSFALSDASVGALDAAPGAKPESNAADTATTAVFLITPPLGPV